MRVFLSYHTPDEALARQLKGAIENRSPGSEVFFAPYNLRLGAFWLPALGEAISSANGFLLLIGDHGLGPWQKLEYYEALDRRTHEPTFPLVPVITGKNAPGLPFLRNLHWIQTPDPAAPGPIETIVGAMHGGAGLPAAPEPWRTINPYRGLLALKEEDADFFFGRDAETAAVLEAITGLRNKVISLVGNSGVGKSSLVQAGIIGALKRQRPIGAAQRAWPEGLKESRRWAYLTMKPGDNPIRALSGAFTSQWFDRPTDPSLFEQMDRWTERLGARGRLSELIDATHAHFEQIGVVPPRRVFLYIDQGEELYARSAKPAQQRFSELIADGLSDERLIVMSSLRSDYYGQLQADGAIFGHTQRIDIPPLDSDSLVSVLREPARTLNATFDNEDLVSVLVRGARQEPGALPLLADFMTELWKEMQVKGDGVLRLATHTDIIQVGAVLAKRADEFLSQNARHREAVKRLFSLKLALVQEEGEPVRRRLARNNATDEEWVLIEKLAAPEWRLLVTGEEHGQPTAEVAHEVLLREWPTLRTWLADQREFLIWLGQVERARKDYEAAPKREKREALLMGRALSEAESWLAARPKDIAPQEVEFIRASIARRNAQRFRARVAGATAVGGLAVFAAFAFASWQQAKEALARVELEKGKTEQALVLAETEKSRAEAAKTEAVKEAERAEQQKALAEQARLQAESEKQRAEDAEQKATRESMAAKRGQSIYLAELARRSHEQQEILKSILLSVEALPDEKRGVKRPLVKEAEELAATSFYAMMTDAAPDDLSATVERLLPIPGSPLVLAAFDDPFAKIVDSHTQSTVAVLTGHVQPVSGLAASADGKTVATASKEGMARIWDVPTRRQIALLGGHVRPINAIALDAKGEKAATASDDGTVRIWNARTGAEIAQWSGDGKPKDRVQFDPAGTSVIAGNENNLVLWSFPTSDEPVPIEPDQYGSFQINAFIPGTTRLVTKRYGEAIKVLELPQMKAVLEMPYEGSTDGTAVSSDGKKLFIGAYIEAASTIFDLESGSPIADLEDYTKSVKSAVFSRDGSLLLTGSDDDTARLWDVRTGKALQIEKVGATVNAVAFADGEDAFLTGSSNGLGRWPIRKDAPASAAPAPGDEAESESESEGIGGSAAVPVKDEVQSIAFSPDATNVLMTTESGRAVLKDTKTHAERGEFLASGAIAGTNAFSPDGALVALGLSNGTAGIWNTASLEKAATLTRSPAKSIAFDTTSRKLAVNTGVLKLQAVTPGADPAQFEIAAPSSGSIIVRMSSDGRFAITTDGGSTVDLWSLQSTGAPSRLETFSEKSPVELVAFGEGVPAFVIMTKAGLARAVLVDDNGKTENVVLHAELKIGKMQDHGAVFAGAEPDGTVHFWNLATTRASKAPVDPERERSNLSPYDLELLSGAIAALRCGSDVVEIWDIDEGRLVSVINADKSVGSNAGISLSADGRRALLEHDDGLTVWDTGTGALVKKITPKKYNLYDWQRLNDTGSRLLILNENRVDLYDASTGALILSRPGQNMRSGFADGGTRLLVKGMNGSVELRDAADGRLIGELGEPLEALRGSDESAKAHRIVVTASHNRARLFDSRTGAPVATLEGHKREVTSVQISADGDRILTIDEDNNAIVWSAAGVQLSELRLGGPAGHLIMSEDGNRILVSTFVPRTLILDRETGWKQTAVLEGHTETVSSADFSADGRRIATASQDRKIGIWDAPSGKIERFLEGHESGVNMAKFSADGKRLLSASDDGTVRLWDVDAGTSTSLAAEKNIYFYDVRFSPKGTYALARTSGKEVHLWRLSDAKKVAVPRIKDSAPNAIGFLDGSDDMFAVFSNAMVVFDPGSGESRRTINLDTSEYSWSGAFEDMTFSDDGRVAVSKSGAIMNIEWSTDNIANLLKEALPRCLTTAERRTFHLDPEPPEWCIELGKWPYATPEWTSWLSEKRAGREPALPIEADVAEMPPAAGGEEKDGGNGAGGAEDGHAATPQ